MELNDYDPRKTENKLNLMIELVIGFVFIYRVRDGAATLLLLKCVKHVVTLLDVIGCFSFGDSTLDMLLSKSPQI